MNQQPLVSVIVPCYKQAEFLPEALDSVLAQTYPNWECVIVNDGSPDNTEELAQAWLAKDPRFKYIKQENQGLSAARNAGIENSSGKYILPLDSDDKIAPEYLQEAVQVLEDNANVKVVECEVQLFGVYNGIWKRPLYNFKHLLLFNGKVATSVYRRKDFYAVGGYDITMYNEDWDFWIRLLAGGGLMHRLPAVRFYYRLRANTMHDYAEGIQNRSFELLYKKNIELFFREFGAPQKYIILYETLMKSPRMKLANLLFAPVDVIRIINKKLKAFLGKSPI